jgi:hypothetical protein
MASMPERISVLETQVKHLVETIEEHREEARLAARAAREDRDAMQTELKALTSLAADGKSRLATLFWVASLFSGSLGAGIVYAFKHILPFWPRT